MNNKNDYFQVVVDRIENHHAVLDCGHSQRLTVACRFLPKNIKEGDVVVIQFLTEEMAGQEKATLARHILMEILGGRPS